MSTSPTTRHLPVVGDQISRAVAMPLDQGEDLLNFEALPAEFDGLPIVRATVEGLSVRPKVNTLYYIPLAYGRADWFFGHTCGWVSREHGTAVRAAKEACPVCLDSNMGRIRRRHYLARLAVERSA